MGPPIPSHFIQFFAALLYLWSCPTARTYVIVLISLAEVRNTRRIDSLAWTQPDLTKHGDKPCLEHFPGSSNLLIALPGRGARDREAADSCHLVLISRSLDDLGVSDVAPAPTAFTGARTYCAVLYFTPSVCSVHFLGCSSHQSQGARAWGYGFPRKMWR